jgi:hypothetical protein
MPADLSAAIGRAVFSRRACAADWGEKVCQRPALLLAKRNHREKWGSGRNGNAELIGDMVAECAPENAVDEVDEFSGMSGCGV